MVFKKHGKGLYVDYSYLLTMARGTPRTIKVNGSIVFETCITKGRRFTCPDIISDILTPGRKVRITIEPTEGYKQ